MTAAGLHLDWADHEAAVYAVMHWHYSQAMPTGRLIKVGVWEAGKFMGVVLFGRGAAPHIGSPYDLKQTEICELVRVALRPGHATPVSRIGRIALMMNKRQSPGLRAVVSYADSGEGHHGGIYQAMGWIYVGSEEHTWLRVNGELVHPKTLHSKYGKGGQSIPWLRANVDPKAERVVTPPKHKYLWPYDDEMRARFLELAKPYPKRGRPVGGPQVPPGDDGASPIRPLHPCGSQPQPSSGPGSHAPGPEEGGTP